MSDKRRDSKGRLLKQGERQREDGKYEYRYYDEKGGRHSVYSWRLVDTDRIPPGKRDAESLRSMEKRIRRRSGRWNQNTRSRTDDAELPL